MQSTKHRKFWASLIALCLGLAWQGFNAANPNFLPLVGWLLTYGGLIGAIAFGLMWWAEGQNDQPESASYMTTLDVIRYLSHDTEWAWATENWSRRAPDQPGVRWVKNRTLESSPSLRSRHKL